MFCTNCGQQIDDNAAVCPYCGAPTGVQEQGGYGGAPYPQDPYGQGGYPQGGYQQGGQGYPGDGYMQDQGYQQGGYPPYQGGYDQNGYPDQTHVMPSQQGDPYGGAPYGGEGYPPYQNQGYPQEPNPYGDYQNQYVGDGIEKDIYGDTPGGDQKKKSIVPLIIGIVCLAVALLAAVWFVFLRDRDPSDGTDGGSSESSVEGKTGSEQTVKLGGYYTVAFTGTDGSGLAELDFDEQKFDSDLDSALERGGKVSDDDLKDDVKMKEIREKLKNCYTAKLDRQNGLKNGDKVIVSYDINNATPGDYNIRFTGEDSEHTVNGLLSVPSFDPFQGVDITFSGRNGEGMIAIANGVEDLIYQADKLTGLSNGDVVNVSVVSAFENDADFAIYAEQHQQMPDPVTTQMTVSGLTDGLTDVSQLPAEDIAALDSFCKDKKYKEVQKTWVASEESLDSMTLIGQYLLVPKSGDTDHDILYMVYRMHYRWHDGRNFDYYYYYRFDDVYLSDNGALIYDTDKCSFPDGEVKNGRIIGEAVPTYSDNYVSGHPSVDSIYQTCIVPQMGGYTVSSNIR